MQRDQLRVVLRHVDVVALDQRREVGQHPVLNERGQPRGVHPEQVRSPAGDELGDHLLLVVAVRDVLDVHLDVRVELLELVAGLLVADLLVRVPQRVGQGDRAAAVRTAEAPARAGGQQGQGRGGDHHLDDDAGAARRRSGDPSGPRVHRLIPVSEMEFTMCLWKIANRMTMGISATSAPARIRFHWTLKLELKFAMATVSTFRELEFVTISGHMKLFQPNTNASSVAVMMIGRDIGSTMRHRIRLSEQPSSRAASITSFGIVMKYCRIRNTEYGTPST